MRKSELKRSSPLGSGSGLNRKPMKRSRRKHRKRIPKDMRERVLEITGGFCFLCGVRRAVHLHHFLPVQRWPELELDEDNLRGMCFDCHMGHENASKRIPYEALPRDTLEMVYGHPAAEDYLKRIYPRYVPEKEGIGP